MGLGAKGKASCSGPPYMYPARSFPFPFPFVTLRLFGPSARPSLAPRCWPGDPSACHIGRKPCGSAAPHSLYAAPGGDLPRSGCSYRSGITGTPACPLMGARRSSASSQLCGCDFLPPPRGASLALVWLTGRPRHLAPQPRASKDAQFRASTRGPRARKRVYPVSRHGVAITAGRSPCEFCFSRPKSSQVVPSRPTSSQVAPNHLKSPLVVLRRPSSHLPRPLVRHIPPLALPTYPLFRAPTSIPSHP